MNINYLHTDLNPIQDMEYTITTNTNPTEWYYVDMSTNPPTYTTVDHTAIESAKGSD